MKLVSGVINSGNNLLLSVVSRREGTVMELPRYFTLLDAPGVDCQVLCVNSFALVLTMFALFGTHQNV